MADRPSRSLPICNGAVSTQLYRIGKDDIRMSARLKGGLVIPGTDPKFQQAAVRFMFQRHNAGF